MPVHKSRSFQTGVFALLLSVAPAAFADTVSTCKGVDGHAASFGGRRTFLLRPDWLTALKAKTDTPEIRPAFKALMTEADKALNGPNYSVVDKTRTPPSGDKHDYMSMGPYWWPTPGKPDGLPYMRRDGEFNPERSTGAFDVTRLEAMTQAVEALSLAYYYTNDARYAKKAAELIRVWFLDPATRMNPNARFAQGVPGQAEGRAEGVLDTSRLLRVVEAIGLITPAKGLDAAQQKAIEQWFSDYSDWMLQSPTGRGERDKANNHGIWYDYQLITFALFARRPDIARDVLNAFPEQRLETQIEPDGRMPLELERTRALHYTVFALAAAAGVAEAGRCLGYDIWSYSSADGRGMKKALDFIAPYAGRGADFPYKELEPDETGGMFDLMAHAAWAYGSAPYAAATARLSPLNPVSDTHLKVDRYRP
jgi:hypothetical protein